MSAPPFHPGELRVQERAGVRDMTPIGARVIRDHMPDQHRELFEKLPYVAVGAVHEGRPWASFLVGMPGFLHTPDARTITVDALPVRGDPIGDALVVGARAGLLGVELHTRRRNRANGVVRSRDARGVVLGIEESFGNCPQYIQARAPLGAVERPPVVARVERGALSDEARALVTATDTLFIASAEAGERGRVDVSHRGGRPGFVRVDGERLTFPDFAGNNFFMTLGNLEAHPRAGIAVLDFASGALLTLTGTTETIWDGPELASFRGAERLVRLTVEEGVRLENAVPFVWTEAEPARQLAVTGTW